MSVQGADVPELPVPVLNDGPAPFAGQGVVVEVASGETRIREWGRSVAEVASSVFAEACKYRAAAA